MIEPALLKPADACRPTGRGRSVLYENHGSQVNIQGSLWPGGPKRTPFPRDCSRDQIMHNISDIVSILQIVGNSKPDRRAHSAPTSAKPSLFKADEWRNGIQVRIIYHRKQRSSPGFD